MSSLVFRAVRDSVPNTVSQERLVGTVLEVLAIADVSQPIWGRNTLANDPWIGLPVCRLVYMRKVLRPPLAVSVLSSHTLGCPKRSGGILALGTQ